MSNPVFWKKKIRKKKLFQTVICWKKKSKFRLLEIFRSMLSVKKNIEKDDPKVRKELSYIVY